MVWTTSGLAFVLTPELMIASLAIVGVVGFILFIVTAFKEH